MNIDLLPEEVTVDFFAGGGGASEGIEQAIGRPIDFAVNHDPKALAMHAANHPETRHLCEDVFTVDMRQYIGTRPVGLWWFSPDCKHHSNAKGGKPVEKAIRGLAWVVLKCAGMFKPRVIGLENVVEFQSWGMVHRLPSSRKDKRRCRLCRGLYDGRPCPQHKGVTFKRWCTQLRNLGYTLEFREIVAAKHGAPTIRKRLFVIARRDGHSIAWPAPTHGPGLLPYRTAAECIDFSIPCPSIFLTKREAKKQKLRVIRPLADKTLARIAKGVHKYVLWKRRPFLVALTHHGSDRVYDTEVPINTVTGAHRGEFALVSPTLVQTGYGEREGQSPRSLDIEKPIGTLVSGGKHALVSSFLARYNGTKPGGNERTASVEDPLPVQPTENRFANVSVFLSRQFGASIGGAADEPAPTITSGGGGKTALVQATFMAQHNTERGGAIKAGRQVDQPIATITATGGQTQLVASTIVKMHGTTIAQPIDDPLHTISAGGLHYAEIRCFLKKYLGEDVEPIVEIDGETYMIVDIGMRMLSARELFRCQGFPETYQIEGGRDVCNAQGSFLAIAGEWIPLNSTEQIRMCGNSVSPPPCRALIEAQFGRDRTLERAA